jgi:prophage tail gpP-like protein
MAKISKNVVDADLRNRIFSHLDIANAYTEDSLFYKINDRQYGVILTDKNGIERYCRVGVIVAEEREDMTARELMQKEIDEYNAKQASKAEKAKAKEEKIAHDKKAREEKKKKEEEGE